MILQLAPDYYNTRLYSLLVDALRLQGVESAVYVADNAATHPNHGADIVVAEKAFSTLERTLFFPKQRYLLADIEQRISLTDIACVHAHTLFSSGYTAYQLHARYGIPYIVAVRNTDVNVFFRYMVHLRHLGRKIAQHAERVIFISPAYQQQVIGRYLPADIAKKSLFIPNGIDPLFLTNQVPHTPHLQQIRLIFVGNISRAKNIDTTLQVADHLRRAGEDVQLTLVGELKEPRYRKMIGERAYVRWLPKSPKEQVLQLLRENDILLMPSFAETFGLVYAEAMSQGLPVIYTKGQGFDGQYPEGEVGFAVAPTAVAEIVRRIYAIRADYAAISQRCVQNAQRYDWQQIANTYKTLYQTIQR